MKYTSQYTTIDEWRVELSRLLLSFQRGICDGKTGRLGTFRSIEEFVEKEIEYAKKTEANRIYKALDGKDCGFCNYGELIKEVCLRELCPNCGQNINKSVENAEDKLKTATALETGKNIYYSILDGKFKSIELCNWCYSVMQAYRYSLPKEDRQYMEGGKNANKTNR
jgi:hypothetical protein